MIQAWFFASRRLHASSKRDWSSDVCSYDLSAPVASHHLSYLPILANSFPYRYPSRRLSRDVWTDIARSVIRYTWINRILYQVRRVIIPYAQGAQRAVVSKNGLDRGGASVEVSELCRRRSPEWPKVRHTIRRVFIRQRHGLLRSIAESEFAHAFAEPFILKHVGSAFSHPTISTRLKLFRHVIGEP